LADPAYTDITESVSKLSDLVWPFFKRVIIHVVVISPFSVP
jgi:hypothetical protein